MLRPFLHAIFSRIESWARDLADRYDDRVPEPVDLEKLFPWLAENPVTPTQHYVIFDPAKGLVPLDYEGPAVSSPGGRC